MTEDEKRQQKAMLLLEYQEAEEHLANLQEKAKRISARLLAVSKWMENCASGGAVSDKVHVSELGGVVSVSSPEIIDAVNFPAARSLYTELMEAQRRVRELSDRKHSLGLK